MYLQVQNTTKEKHNQILTTKSNLVKDIKKQDWNILDCKVFEVKNELIENKYRGSDGKNYISSKQYLQRAGGKSKANVPKVNETLAMVG